MTSLEQLLVISQRIDEYFEMITESQYNAQLSNLTDRLSRCSFVKSISQKISKSSQHIVTGITSLCPHGCQYQVHFLIRYNANYASPTLLFQVYRPILTIESDLLIESYEITYESSIIERLIRDKSFKYSLTQINSQEGGENWWFIHPCDVNELIPNEEHDENSLVSWFSIYGGALFDIRVDEFFGN